MKALILGTGSWGTAFGLHLSKNWDSVQLWGIEESQVGSINNSHNNPDFLPGITLPSNISATLDLTSATQDADAVFIVTPSQVTRSVVQQLAKCSLNNDVPIIGMSKGLELSTLKRMSEVISEEISTDCAGNNHPVAVLLGPSHAEEVAFGQPSAVVLAGSGQIWHHWQKLLSSKRFRVYTNEDITGVEISSAFKNVLAIATGISDGLGYGDNTRGALLTRGLTELSLLGNELGGKQETFYGLAGIGDIITTCTSVHSRNRNFGEAFVKENLSPTDILNRSVQIVEGVVMTEAAMKYGNAHNLELPISNEVYNMLFKGKDPELALTDLMDRTLRAE
jgi:glycerol-3-phosphate dehydrogenase (NAD(P)+)